MTRTYLVLSLAKDKNPLNCAFLLGRKLIVIDYSFFLAPGTSEF